MKRYLAIFALAIVTLLFVPGRVNAEIINSGTCGDDSSSVSWTLDDEGTLVISGEGTIAINSFKDLIVLQCVQSASGKQAEVTLYNRQADVQRIKRIG